MSEQQVKIKINKEKSKNTNKYDWYDKILCSKNNDTIDLFFENCGTDHNSIFNDYALCELIDEALENNDFVFIEKLVNHQQFNFNTFNIELFFSKKFFQPEIIQQRLDILKFFFDALLQNKNFTFKKIYFEKVLFNLWETGVEDMECISNMGDTEFIDFFIKKSQTHPSFSFKFIKFENILKTVCNIYNSSTLIKSTIENCLKHKTFNFKSINFEIILLRLIEYTNQNNCNHDIIKLFLKKSLHHQTFDIENFNITNTLLFLK